MAKASNDPETDAWIQAYRARQAERAGRSFIDGQPAEIALGATPAEVAVRNPVLPALGVSQIPAVTPQQADMAMQSAERIGAETAVRQRNERNVRRDRYNEFLEQQGINPNSIGAATLTGTAANRTLQAPTLAQQQSAQDAADFSNAQEGRARIAARRAYQRGDGGYWADIMSGVDQSREARGGGRNSEQNRRYWMDRILNAYPYRQGFWGMNSNGFGG